MPQKKAVEHHFHPPPSYLPTSVAKIVIPVYCSAGVLSLWRFSRKCEIPQEKHNGHHNCDGFGSVSDSVTVCKVSDAVRRHWGAIQHSNDF